MEVVDLSSNVMLYSLSDGRKVVVEGGTDALETCPEWSPDGRTLYTVRTADPPFPLPLASPDDCFRRMESYNVPEFER